MGRWQPYLRTSESDSPFVDKFNPKAVTMASYRLPPPKKPKPDGPLIDFNRHPDSHIVLPFNKTKAKPMNPTVKVWIKVTRWIQCVFRVLTLFGAVGVLLCAIFIRGAGNTEGYIIRIPPGVDMVNCLYAIYHLLRAAKSRPAGSSASYHFFAAVMDAGFIPFYVFTALLSKRNYNEPAGTDGRWRTFFPTDEETDKVLQAAWLAATTVGGLHIASIILDLYLVIMFRKISKLPPDMNPLEDNLTSRQKTKHKHKNSSISAITPLTAEDKRLSTQSGKSTLVGDRNSQSYPLISEKEIPAPEENQIHFMHTRNNSAVAYSPHTPNSARYSRSLYSQQASAQQSRTDLNHRDDLHRRHEDSDNETLAQRKSFLAQQNLKRSSRPQSMASSRQEFYTPPSTTETKRSTGDISQQSLQSDNWFVHTADNEDEEVPRNRPQSMFASKSGQGYRAVATYDDVSDEELEPPMMPQPLRMNPPTPPPAKMTATAQGSTEQDSSEATLTRSPSRTSTPKPRFYGDLQAATRSIRNGGSPANASGPSPTKPSTPNDLPSSTKLYTTNAPMPKPAPTSPFSLDKKAFSSVRRTGEVSHSPVRGQSPRVISRTGVDYSGRYDFDDESDLGTPGRRRDVSGKIAEEGRGGLGNGGKWGMRARKVSGVAA